MALLGVLLVLLGVSTLLFRDADVLGLPATGFGIGLAVAGVAVFAGGLAWRSAKRRRKIAAGEPVPVGNVFDRAKALPRLLRARREGYDGLPKGRLALWGFALVYLVSPIDILPELLPIIGVTDDAGVLVWLLTSVSAASGMFLRWERDRVRPQPKS
ncbi:YkvA family protein [Amycolatopsis magusensis]|uniref:YkvA family protein n=1 Tax=Amycolatopsis magusensis TaxID=882444 RepID=UPI0024A9AF4C|nr:YkvA family protein [Amycolatopsis magusensis]MDI5975446.1 YkvA family protein [Amycolatopsis magusensis]